MNSKTKITFYIDGFNFYFGFKRAAQNNPKWNNAYWIDITKLCKSFLDNNNQELKKVIYFTASPLGRRKNARQGAFLNANKILNPDLFEIVRGKYMDKQIMCPYCQASIPKPEEKKTDVNISIRMIYDCIAKNTDQIILISADSDLIPPLQMIKNQFPDIKVKVYFPPSDYSNDIKNTLLQWNSKPVLLEKNYSRFEKAIMPDTVTVNNKSYKIPTEWKNKQILKPNSTVTH